jgi:translation initiation factor IF-2
MNAANGLKIAATGLDEAVAGTPLFVCKSQEEVEEAMIICNDEFDNIKKKIKL